MASGLKTNQGWIDEVVNDFSDLETINNSKETAPSKRIENNATYIKTLDLSLSHLPFLHYH
jgi:hypothetical protein